MASAAVILLVPLHLESGVEHEVWNIYYANGASAGEATKHSGQVVNTAGNIVLFIPIGVTAAFITNRWWLSIIVAVAFSASAEAIQVTTPYRHGSLVDVALNTVGAVVGEVIFFGIRRFVRQTKRRRSVR